MNYKWCKTKKISVQNCNTGGSCTYAVKILLDWHFQVFDNLKMYRVSKLGQIDGTPCTWCVFFQKRTSYRFDILTFTFSSREKRWRIVLLTNGTCCRFWDKFKPKNPLCLRCLFKKGATDVSRKLSGKR
jgi:hypothetical protein